MKTNNWPLKWSPCLWHCCIDRQRLPNKINCGWKLKKNCFIFHFLLLAPYAIRRWKHWFNWSHVLPVYIYVCIHNTIKKWPDILFTFDLKFASPRDLFLFSFHSGAFYIFARPLHCYHCMLWFLLKYCDV